MAVQKSKKSRSKRGMRCAHDAITGATLSEDSSTGEIHRRHHISANGVYRGRQVLPAAEDTPEDEEE
jgi:large subunit ribosomal protein L32